ncbi:gluconokinase [Niabella hibiscisoli]|uniref:gluconokinase n=1 Tax=Niabella hibiscisoli TaxID=1825928 RepID=UPI001F0E3E61|nr:gluconokinase, GntK/IdnK-type [Niabella hibiscisoli]MCH5718499.1 gluconokinase, GntK/IdnK-type [Niabella hibiscisoli]
MMASIVIVMGVSGSGKTSVGEAIAKVQQRIFIDGDDLHPQVNVDKMSQGIALTDEDREGWLNTIVREAVIMNNSGKAGLITCSALKRRYRDRLRSGIASVVFVYLKASYDKVLQQLATRSGHFMPVSLLGSQFELLEEPDESEDDVVTIEVQESLEATIAVVLKHFA